MKNQASVSLNRSRRFYILNFLYADKPDAVKPDVSCFYSWIRCSTHQTGNTIDEE